MSKERYVQPIDLTPQKRRALVDALMELVVPGVDDGSTYFIPLGISGKWWCVLTATFGDGNSPALDRAEAMLRAAGAVVGYDFDNGPECADIRGMIKQARTLPPAGKMPDA